VVMTAGDDSGAAGAEAASTSGFTPGEGWLFGFVVLVLLCVGAGVLLVMWRRSRGGAKKASKPTAFTQLSHDAGSTGEVFETPLAAGVSAEDEAGTSDAVAGGEKSHSEIAAEAVGMGSAAEPARDAAVGELASTDEEKFAV